MRIVCGFWPAAFCAGSAVLAQQPTFRIATTLVEFTMVVQDAKGNPVTDLRQDEVVITENGRAREVTFFRFEGAPEAAPIAPRPLSPGIFSNRPEYAPGPPRNITAIVIDALNTAPADQLTVRAQVMQYLSTIAPDTRVAIYRAGERITVVHDFTDDIRSLRKRFSGSATEAVVHTGTGVAVAAPEIPEWQRLAMGEGAEYLQEALAEQARLDEASNQQIQNRRSGLTLRSLTALGNHLAAIPGRKSIIWITPGTPTMVVGATDPWVQSYEDAIRGAAYRMATQGVTVYPVEATGIRPPNFQAATVSRGASLGSAGVGGAATSTSRTSVTSPPVSSRGVSTASLKDMSTTPDTRRLPSAIEVLAEVTGGRTIRNTNDLTEGMKVAAEDLRGTYSLGFYMAQEPDGRWHTFSVDMKRPGVKVVHRKGYLGIATKQAQEWKDDDWRAAANNPLRSTGIRIDARLSLVAGGVTAVVVLPAEDLQFRPIKSAPTTELDVALAEKTAAGLTGLRHEVMGFQIEDAQMSDLGSVRVRFPKQWRLRPGTTAIRLIVRDRFSERYGTLEVPVTELR